MSAVKTEAYLSLSVTSYRGGVGGYHSSSLCSFSSVSPTWMVETDLAALRQLDFTISGQCGAPSVWTVMSECLSWTLQSPLLPSLLSPSVAVGSIISFQVELVIVVLRVRMRTLQLKTFSQNCNLFLLSINKLAFFHTESYPQEVPYIIYSLRPELM